MIQQHSIAEQRLRGASAPVHLAGSLVGHKGHICAFFRPLMTSTARCCLSSKTASKAAKPPFIPSIPRAPMTTSTVISPRASTSTHIARTASSSCTLGMRCT